MNRYLMTLLAISLSGCATVVSPGHVAVKVTLGKMDKAPVQPGMVFYTPFIDGFRDFSTKQEAVDGEASPLTSDQQPIIIKYKVLLRVPEANVIKLTSEFQGDPYQNLVAPQVQEAFRQVISQHKAAAVNKNIDSIKNEILAIVRQNVKGLVEVVDIPITHVDLPETLQKAIAEKQVMEQQALQKAYELDKAKKEAEITVAKAKADAEAIRVQTEALSKSPSLIKYEAVKKWDGVLPRIVTSDKLSFLLKDGE
jgi:regulator of protease activity HflC (stomatin/prohibitin superfamily)